MALGRVLFLPGLTGVNEACPERWKFPYWGSMETPKSETPADGYLVLQNRKFVGPFSRVELESEWKAGRISGESLAQIEGTPLWQPVRLILRRLPEPRSQPEELPGWGTLLRWGGRRIRVEMEQPSLRATWIALGAGSLALLAMHAPFLFWVPWFGFALIAAASFLRAGKWFVGLFLLLAIFGLPLLLLPSQRSKARSFEELPTVAENVPAQPPPHGSSQSTGANTPVSFRMQETLPLEVASPTPAPRRQP